MIDGLDDGYGRSFDDLCPGCEVALREAYEACIERHRIHCRITADYIYRQKRRVHAKTATEASADQAEE